MKYIRTSSGYEYNSAFVGAFRKGYEARRSKKSIESNPYCDKRKHDGRLTFSRAFYKRWNDGWKLCQWNEYHGDYDGYYHDRLDQNYA